MCLILLVLTVMAAVVFHPHYSFYLLRRLFYYENLILLQPYPGYHKSADHQSVFSCINFQVHRLRFLSDFSVLSLKVWWFVFKASYIGTIPAVIKRLFWLCVNSNRSVNIDDKNNMSSVV